jgi:hypothetical protein
MSLVPLLYFSRGQLESRIGRTLLLMWPRVFAKGEVKSAAVTIRHLRKEVLSNLIAKQVG